MCSKRQTYLSSRVLAAFGRFICSNRTRMAKRTTRLFSVRFERVNRASRVVPPLPSTIASIKPLYSASRNKLCFFLLPRQRTRMQLSKARESFPPHTGTSGTYTPWRCPKNMTGPLQQQPLLKKTPTYRASFTMVMSTLEDSVGTCESLHRQKQWKKRRYKGYWHLQTSCGL